MRRLLLGLLAALAVVTLPQLLAAQDGKRPDGPRPEFRRERPSPEAIFQRLDQKHQGFILLDKLPPGMPEPMKQMLKKADANKDGKLTLDELKAAMKAHRPSNRPSMGEQRRGPGGPKAMEASDRAIFNRLDTNKDGKLSFEEFAAGLRQFREMVAKQAKAWTPPFAGRMYAQAPKGMMQGFACPFGPMAFTAKAQKHPGQPGRVTVTVTRQAAPSHCPMAMRGPERKQAAKVMEAKKCHHDHAGYAMKDGHDGHHHHHGHAMKHHDGDRDGYAMRGGFDGYRPGMQRGGSQGCPFCNCQCPCCSRGSGFQGRSGMADFDGFDGPGWMRQFQGHQFQGGPMGGPWAHGSQYGMERHFQGGCPFCMGGFAGYGYHQGFREPWGPQWYGHGYGMGRHPGFDGPQWAGRFDGREISGRMDGFERRERPQWQKRPDGKGQQMKRPEPKKAEMGMADDRSVEARLTALENQQAAMLSALQEQQAAVMTALQQTNELINARLAAIERRQGGFEQARNDGPSRAWNQRTADRGPREVASRVGRNPQYDDDPQDDDRD
ncbi:MAG: EF-hand domain-containing protein [Thermoguttaceae bacterium]